MIAYTAYGISIQSTIELPELVATSSITSPLTIRFGSVGRLPDDMDRHFHSYWATPQEVCLCFQGIGNFLVRQGNEIIIDPAPNVEDRVLRLGILGPALSMALHQRGFLVLHGSAVAIDGYAITFLGNSGDGKSTMAGALHARGHQVIADDLSVVKFDSRGLPFLLPGFPLLKLWPEAVSSLGENPASLDRLHPNMEKRARRIEADTFSSDSLPLRSLFVLQEANEIVCQAIPHQMAFVELVRHSHDALLLEATNTSVAHFQQCTQLVNSVPMYWLKRPRLFSALPDVASLVEDTLG